MCSSNRGVPGNLLALQLYRYHKSWSPRRLSPANFASLQQRQVRPAAPRNSAALQGRRWPRGLPFAPPLFDNSSCPYLTYLSLRVTLVPFHINPAVVVRSQPGESDSAILSSCIGPWLANHLLQLHSLHTGITLRPQLQLLQPGLGYINTSRNLFTTSSSLSADASICSVPSDTRLY